tara:strand:- start:6375 stop:7520 length:1146 start_codon:yes stop_codon:yes gene_type:complete
MKCKICDSRKIYPLFNGTQYQKTGVYSLKKTKKKIIQIRILFCKECYFIFKKKNLKSNFSYSKINRNTENQLPNYIDKIINSLNKLKLNKNSVILEVGSNDNTFLNKLCDNFNNLVGIEPSTFLSKQKKNRKIKIFNNYLNKIVVKKIINSFGKPKLIISRHTLEHVEKINHFMKNISLLLNNKDKLFLEVPDTDWLISKSFFHEIWDEHVNYFTKESICNLAIKHKFKILSVSRKRFRDTRNILIWLQKNDNEVNNKFFLKKNFFNYIKKSKNKWEVIKKLLLNKIKKSEKPIIGVGAGHNQLNFLNFTKSNKSINYLTDDDPFKNNKYVNLSRNIKIIKSEKLSNFKKGTLLLTCFPFPNFHRKLKKNFKNLKTINPYD